MDSTTKAKTRKAPATKAKRTKPEKPYPEFPLYAHRGLQWAKKIKGRTYYFGPWEDPKAARLRYEAELPSILDGTYFSEDVAPKDSETTVEDLANRFLDYKNSRMETGELNVRTYRDYLRTAKFVADMPGWRNRPANSLRPLDFRKLRTFFFKRLSPRSVDKEMRQVRIIFNYGVSERLIDAPFYGNEFDKPSEKVLQEWRDSQGEPTFTREEILRLIDKADPLMRAIILLGINCGYSNTDISNCTTLFNQPFDLKNGWSTLKRSKVVRRYRKCPLWSETVDAIKEYRKRYRPEPSMASGAEKLMFLTPNGRKVVWINLDRKTSKLVDEGVAVPDDYISKAFSKLRTKAKIKPNGRKRLGFSSLRHTFKTQARTARDPETVEFLMGHVGEKIANHYLNDEEGFKDEALRHVTDTVRAWLYGD